MSAVQYSPKVDAVIYGPETTGFTPEDWVTLAVAALEHAMNKTNRVAIRCALDHLEPIKEL